MNQSERAAFRAEHADKSCAELQQLHNAESEVISAARKRQSVFHELQTEKEHTRERAKSAGRAQTLQPGEIDDDMILSKLRGDPSLLDRLLAKLKGDKN